MKTSIGAVLVLTGAGIGASVTLRQVRATRDQIRETATASRNQLKLSEQGLVTDRYTKAVEQLGHEKAPVRLGALYSLEHLAQDNPQYRQTVVDVVCAYLRMPYIPPTRNNPDASHVEQAMTPAEDGIPPAHPVLGQSPAQEELQVRKTGQRLLADHLRCPPRTSAQEAQQAFWPGISLDLTGATLIDFNFKQVSVIQAQFVGATFQGYASFGEATFQGEAGFSGATFHDAIFGEVTFQGHAWFNEVTFQGRAWFDGAIFHSAAVFGGATFQGLARFRRATFQREAWFGRATFQHDAWFGGATFQGDARFSGAHVLHFDNRDRRRVWPDGWIVLRDPTDPSHGTLVPAEHAKEPKPAAPPSDHTDNR
jgi:hypothetical protein